MAVTQSGTSVAGGGNPPIRARGFRGLRLWRTPRCYIPRAFGVLDSFYVKERFGPFTRWARIPLMQPLLVNAPAEPVNKPGPDVICAGR